MLATVSTMDAWAPANASTSNSAMRLMCIIFTGACRAAEALPDARPDWQLRHTASIYRAKLLPSSWLEAKALLCRMPRLGTALHGVQRRCIWDTAEPRTRQPQAKAYLSGYKGERPGGRASNRPHTTFAFEGRAALCCRSALQRTATGAALCRATVCPAARQVFPAMICRVEAPV